MYDPPPDLFVHRLVRPPSWMGTTGKVTLCCPSVPLEMCADQLWGLGVFEGYL